MPLQSKLTRLDQPIEKRLRTWLLEPAFEDLMGQMEAEAIELEIKAVADCENGAEPKARYGQTQFAQAVELRNVIERLHDYRNRTEDTPFVKVTVSVTP